MVIRWSSLRNVLDINSDGKADIIMIDSHARILMDGLLMCGGTTRVIVCTPNLLRTARRFGKGADALGELCPATNINLATRADSKQVEEADALLARGKQTADQLYIAFVSALNEGSVRVRGLDLAFGSEVNPVTVVLETAKGKVTAVTLDAEGSEKASDISVEIIDPRLIRPIQDKLDALYKRMPKMELK